MVKKSRREGLKGREIEKDEKIRKEIWLIDLVVDSGLSDQESC